MDTNNIEDIISDSLTDAVTTDPVDAPTDAAVVADTPTPDPAVTASPDATEAVVDHTKVETSEIASPGAKVEKSEEDEFAKKFGLPQQTIAGRENRIPYSRVKKIVEKAEKEAVAKAQKDWEGTSNPKFAELDTKVKDYEGRLERVGQFEQVMTTQPREFLNMLSQLPAYKDFFDFVNQAIKATPQTQSGQPAGAPAVDEMPQPDFALEDGTMVYSMDGLKKLQDWQGAQIEARLSKTYEAKLAEVDKQYAPIRQKWEQEQALAKIAPQINKQIDEARKWPQFNENEADIVRALQADTNLSLEGAYRQVVLPKFQIDRDTMRHSLLEEIKKVPQSTATPARGATKPNQVPVGPRSTEDIIMDKLKEAGLM